MASKDHAITFGWQFRPVLGRKSVAPGMRQMFAIISLPIVDSLAENKKINVHVKTYWRKYYPASLTTTDSIGAWPHLKNFFSLWTANAVPNGEVATRDEVLDDAVVVPTTAQYQDALKATVKEVSWTQIDEKTALISVKGENFFSGTTVALAGSSSGGNVIIKSNQVMEIVTPIENIGAGDPMLIGRYGQDQPLMADQHCRLTVLPGGRLSAPFGGQRELNLHLAGEKNGGCKPDVFLAQQLVVFANGKHVPGRPQVFRNGDDAVLIASIPVDLFPKTDGVITVVNPFRGPDQRYQFPWYDNPYELRRTAGNGTSGNETTSIFIRRLDGVSLRDENAFGTNPVWKVEFAGQSYDPKILKDDMMRVDLRGKDVTGSLVLLEPIKDRAADANPYLLDLPAAQPKPKAAVEAASGTSLSISQNDAPKLDFTGEKIGDVATVMIEGKAALKKDFDPDKKVLSVWLTQEITKLPAKLTLQFRDSAGKLITSLILEVKAIPKPSGSENAEKGKAQ